jgi:hypothetical protein
MGIVDSAEKVLPGSLARGGMNERWTNTFRCQVRMRVRCQSHLIVIRLLVICNLFGRGEVRATTVIQKVSPTTGHDFARSTSLNCIRIWTGIWCSITYRISCRPTRRDSITLAMLRAPDLDSDRAPGRHGERAKHPAVNSTEFASCAGGAGRGRSITLTACTQKSSPSCDSPLCDIQAFLHLKHAGSSDKVR